MRHKVVRFLERHESVKKKRCLKFYLAGLATFRHDYRKPYADIQLNTNQRAIASFLNYLTIKMEKKMKDRTFLIYLSIVMTINVIISAIMLFR